MKNWSRITLGAAGIAVSSMIYWRFAVRRQTLPCPSWLSWLLENPFMNSVAGAEAILERLELQPGMSLLDVGCGPGRLTLPAARRVGGAGQVTAVDIQSEMLRRTQRKAQEAGLSNVRLVRAAVGENNLGHDAFDRALLVTVLGEIPDREAALTVIFGALKPGGILSITEVLPDPHYQPIRTVRRLAAQVGFQESAVFGRFPAYTIHLIKPLVEPVVKPEEAVARVAAVEGLSAGS